jgi:hypothetical protein
VVCVCVVCKGEICLYSVIGGIYGEREIERLVICVLEMNSLNPISFFLFFKYDIVIIGIEFECWDARTQ